MKSSELMWEPPLRQHGTTAPGAIRVDWRSGHTWKFVWIYLPYVPTDSASAPVLPGLMSCVVSLAWRATGFIYFLPSLALQWSAVIADPGIGCDVVVSLFLPW